MLVLLFLILLVLRVLLLLLLHLLLLAFILLMLQDLVPSFVAKGPKYGLEELTYPSFRYYCFLHIMLLPIFLHLIRGLY